MIQKISNVINRSIERLNNYMLIDVSFITPNEIAKEIIKNIKKP